MNIDYDSAQQCTWCHRRVRWIGGHWVSRDGDDRCPTGQKHEVTR